MNMFKPIPPGNLPIRIMSVIGMLLFMLLSLTWTDGRKAMASGNADLSYVYHNIFSPDFNSSTTNYTAYLSSSTNQYYTAFMTADPDATMQYSLNGGSWVNLAYYVSTGYLDMNYGTNTLDLKVTASDLVTTKTYHFSMIRSYPNDSTLRALAVSTGTLYPASGTDYTLEVPYTTDSLSLTPTLNDSSATLTVNDVVMTNDTSYGPVALSVGSNTIRVAVTSADASHTTVYRIFVTRGTPSNDSNLSALTLSGTSLSPGFTAGTTSYTANVANEVHSITITPTVADSTATLTVNGQLLSSGSPSTVNLGVGPNAISVMVTAQDGSTKAYTVNVTRAASSNAELSSLTVDQGELTPTFTPSNLDYTVNVPNRVSNLTVSIIKAEPNEILTVTGATYSSVTGHVYTYSASNLIVGTNRIQIVVSAQDGTQNKYKIMVNRMSSSNADLQSLTLSSGILNPAFEADKTEYSASVGNEVSSITVTASVYGSNAVMKVNGVVLASGQESSAISLNAGANNMIIIDVIAEDGTTTKPYKVTVIREAASSPTYGGDDSGSDSSSEMSSSGIVTSTNGILSLSVGKTGEVSLDDEVKVHIPADALAKDLYITIHKVLDTQNLLTDTHVLASPVFDLQKNFPENFNHPVTLTITFDPKGLGNPSIFYYDEAQKIWVDAGGTVDGNRISVQVQHFTKFAVLGEGQGTIPVTDVNPVTRFSDIYGHWAEAKIMQAASEGLISGYPDGTFRPEHTVTRAEFAVMLMHALKAQGDGTKLTFTDTAKIGTWALDSVAQAMQAGILTGYEDGSFRPDAEITRPELAVMVARALGQSSAEATATGFSDDKDIPDWARGAVAALKKLGVIEGKGSNQFAPGDKTTRAEAVTVILKVMEHIRK